MRHRRNYFKRLKYLKGDQKLLLSASFLTFISCFLPWYGISSRVINEWWSAFGNIGSVAGYSIALLSLGIMALVVLPAMDITIKTPWKTEQIAILFAGEVVFLSLLFLMVYTQYSLYDSPNSSIRFGLYGTIFMSIATFISSLIIAKNTEHGQLSSRHPELVKIPRQHRTLMEEERGQESLSLEEKEMEEPVYQQETILAAVADAPEPEVPEFHPPQNFNREPAETEKKESSFNF